MKYKFLCGALATLILMAGTTGIPCSAQAGTTAAEAETTVSDSAEDTAEETTEEEEVFTSGDYRYTLDSENKATIYFYDGTDTNIEVPTKLDDYTVIGLGQGCFQSKDTIESITLSKTIEEIGDNVFYGCTSLKEIKVADGNENFKVVDGVLFSADGTDLYLRPLGLGGDSYDIPEGVIEIMPGAFMNSTVTNFTYPSTLLYVDQWAFAYTNIITLELPDSVQEIGLYAFSYCERLESIDFPDDLTLIQAAAFAGCANLSEVTFHDSLTEIQMAAFAGTSLTSVTIPASVDTIGFCAFGYDTDMTTTVKDFVIYGIEGSQAEVYCTDSDDENDYENNFTFIAVLSTNSGSDVATDTEDEEETAQVTVKDSSKKNFFQSFGKWILLGVAALALIIGGIVLIFGGKSKDDEKKKLEKKAEKIEEKVEEKIEQNEGKDQK